MQLQPERLLAALQDADVSFVVVGGFALAAHGYVRGTQDVDIVPDPTQANLERLSGALNMLGAEIDIGDLAPEEPGIGLDADALAGGGNFRLRTRFGALDVMQDLRGMRSYEHLRHNAVEISLDGVPRPLLFAGYEQLIAMKAAAGRDQDLIDIAELRRARGES
jgi:predicted nucleotidyltransferase